MTIKSGFSLIEITVVIALFGLLSMVASNFLLSTVSTNNKVSLENEVRQNASLVLEDMAGEIRKASCVSFQGGGFKISDATEGSGCGGNIVTYTVNAEGILSKELPNGEVKELSSDKVVFCTSTPSCNANCTYGLDVVMPSDVNDKSVTVNLNVRQKNNTVRSDSCAKLSLSESITPRNAEN